MHNITIYSFKKKSEINVCFLLNTYSFSTLNFLSNLIIASLNSIIIQFNINSIQLFSSMSIVLSHRRKFYNYPPRKTQEIFVKFLKFT